MSNSDEFQYKAWLDANQKFDYYITAIGVAMTAYFIQNLEPLVFGWNSESTQFIGLVIMLGSVFASFIRIERNVTALRVSYDITNLERQLSSIQNPSASVIDSDTGNTLGAESIQDKVGQTQDVIRKARDGRETLAAQSGWAYNVRNWMLIMSLTILLIAKLVPPSPAL